MSVWKHYCLRDTFAVVNSTTYAVDSEGTLTPYPSAEDEATLRQIPSFCCVTVPLDADPAEDAEPPKVANEKKASVPDPPEPPVETPPPSNRGRKRGQK